MNIERLDATEIWSDWAVASDVPGFPGIDLLIQVDTGVGMTTWDDAVRLLEVIEAALHKRLEE